jgi:hypothetical protein
MTSEKMKWLFKGPYWRMSYRGRFLFDLWATPISAAVLAGFVWWRFRPADITGYWMIGVLAGVGVTSACYNYIRWQGQVRDGKPGPHPGSASDRDLG